MVLSLEEYILQQNERKVVLKILLVDLDIIGKWPSLDEEFRHAWGLWSVGEKRGVLMMLNYAN